MLVYISCAKTMTAQSKQKAPLTTEPVFHNEAVQNAMYMSQFNKEELGRMLKVNSKLAVENYFRYHNFFSEDNNGLPAILSYTGMVFLSLWITPSA